MKYSKKSPSRKRGKDSINLPFRVEYCLLLNRFARGGLGYSTGSDAAGAKSNFAHTAVSILMAHRLQVGLKPALGFNVRVADVIAALGYLAAIFAFFGHGVLRICQASFARGSVAHWRRKGLPMLEYMTK